MYLAVAAHSHAWDSDNPPTPPEARTWQKSVNRIVLRLASILLVQFECNYQFACDHIMLLWMHRTLSCVQVPVSSVICVSEVNNIRAALFLAASTLQISHFPPPRHPRLSYRRFLDLGRLARRPSSSSRRLPNNADLRSISSIEWKWLLCIQGPPPRRSLLWKA